MLAAAGIVVTEISTPISAPDLAVLRLSIPAAPAHAATKKVKKSGSLMMLARLWPSLAEVVREQAGRLEREGREVDGGDREREAERERKARAQGQLAALVHRGDAEARQRAELGPYHHRAHDQDRRVLVDPDAGQQRGHHHEREERAGKLDVLVRARLDLLPDDSVRRGALGALDGDLGVLGELRVDLVERDRAVLRDAELAQPGDDDAGVLARDVGQDQVAVRPARRALEQDDVADRLRGLEHLQRGCGLAAARDDPKMDHAPQASGARCVAVWADVFRLVEPNRVVRGASWPSLPSDPAPTFHEHMFPALTTRRPNKRSLSELVRGAVGTALEFATLGEATLDPVHRAEPAPRPVRAPAARPAAPTAAHPHRRRLTRQPTPRRGGTVRPRAHVCRTPVHRPVHRRT